MFKRRPEHDYDLVKVAKWLSKQCLCAIGNGGRSKQIRKEARARFEKFRFPFLLIIVDQRNVFRITNSKYEVRKRVTNIVASSVHVFGLLLLDIGTSANTVLIKLTQRRTPTSEWSNCIIFYHLHIASEMVYWWNNSTHTFVVLTWDMKILLLVYSV